ncbi:MAG: hypothetical protein HYX93_05250 [Chloroflexi bacterium]|nr:hypothetical protein [Chloroflexota bacterium]
MYSASLLVIAAVASIVVFWAAFVVWAIRSGQLRRMDEMRRFPLDDEMSEQEREDARRG